jgi:hypothetical protein
MHNSTLPSPIPATDPTANLFNQPAQPRRPLFASHSESNIFNSGPQPHLSSIRARVEENAAMRHTGPNKSPRSSPDKYTKAIMPTVHDAFPTAIYENIDLTLLDTWETCSGEKLLIQPFDKIADVSNAHANLRSTILSAIAEITQDEDLSISVPIPNGKQSPTTLLAYNLSHEQCNSLLERHVWASSVITFRVMPIDPPCPDFLFTIKDLC